MDAELVRGAVDRYLESIAAADLDAFVAQFAEDVEFRDPADGPPLAGHPGVTRFHKGLRRAWKSLRMRPEHVHIRGDTAAVAWSAEGESAGGAKVEFDGINLMTVSADGRLSRVLGYWDFEGVIARL